MEYYLAQEQRLAQQVEQPTLFTWIVPPTVIYGRHQVREQEVNEAYCSEHGIQVVQRQSGGGCVYADQGNLMVSYIEPHPASGVRSQEPYVHFMSLLAETLQRLGYDAVTTQHNDILVGERKVAGTACYTTPRATIVHACMLYDVNLDALQQAITPSQEKLSKHAVASVRQRVVNLRSVRDLGEMASFRQQLEQTIQIL